MSNIKRKRDNQANLEKDLILNPELVKLRKKKRTQRIVIVALTVLLVLVSSVLGSLMVVRAVGKSHLKKAVEAERPQLVQTEVITEEEAVVWKDTWVKYQGKIYEYNEDIITFLFMGIDKNSDVKEVAEGTNGGQADALFLTVLNPHDKSIKVIGINRNTMTDVNIYNEYGAYVNTVKAQIATQHGFGNGLEESCEYQVDAVRKLMYDLPINGYAAINMSAIPTINDAVGGVTITPIESVKFRDANIVEGETTTLMGMDSFWYVKYRDTKEFGTSDRRLDRQKQYLKAFISKAKGEAKSNPSVVLDIYNAITKQMVTSISADEVAYLAPIVTDYSFSEDSFYNLSGETVMGEKFEEFNVNQDDLYKMILNIFYEEVDVDIK